MHKEMVRSSISWKDEVVETKAAKEKEPIRQDFTDK